MGQGDSSHAKAQIVEPAEGIAPVGVAHSQTLPSIFSRPSGEDAGKRPKAVVACN
ncbi:MAG: hypothetical protein N838_17335 [Thiohalocapsa sp. PB-PSB1]|jgi:hypothetical protein|nr:MAG: hypothetical protein N838_17335 [Thiohalocapsa sp. PB-PSB1]